MGDARGADEEARLHGSGEMPDAPAVAALDDIVLLAAQACAAPIALLGSAGDDPLPAVAGFGSAAREIALERSIRVLVLEGGAPVVIADLTADPRTAAEPAVTDAPAARFYAGVPIVAEGGRVAGVLCVMDHVVRPGGLSATQLAAVEALARLAAQVLAGRRIEADARQHALLEVGDVLRDCTSVGEMTRRAAAIVGRTLHACRAGYGIVDAELHTVDIEPDWTAEGIASIAGRHRFDDYGTLRRDVLHGEALVIDDVDQDPRTAGNPASLHAISVRALVNATVRDGGRPVGIFLVHDSRPRHWTTDELAFIRNVADRLEVGIARLRAEEQQTMLNDEIAHRLKNSLAMVQAIANRTLRGATDPERLAAFQSRVGALGTAHDVLLGRNLRAADIRDIVARAMEGAGAAGRYVASGPAMTFGTRATLSTTLLLHELATNAMKYGALSSDGSVEIAWRYDDGGDGSFTVDWIERDGPVVVPPASKGFGSRLLALGLVGMGDAELHYAPEGLKARFAASREQLEQP